MPQMHVLLDRLTPLPPSLVDMDNMGLAKGCLFVRGVEGVNIHHK